MARSNLATAVVKAVAAVDGVEQSALPPLYDSVDPEILRKLSEQDKAGEPRVTFQFADHQVTVTQDERLFVDGTLQPRDTVVE